MDRKTKRLVNKQIKELLKEEDFYKGVKKGKDWNGYEVYDPILKRKWRYAKIGHPCFIFVKGEEARFGTYEENMEYYHFICPPDDEDEEFDVDDCECDCEEDCDDEDDCDCEFDEDGEE